MELVDIIRIDHYRQEIHRIKLEQLIPIERELDKIISKCDHLTPEGKVAWSKSKLYCKYCMSDIDHLKEIDKNE